MAWKFYERAKKKILFSISICDIVHFHLIYQLLRARSRLSARLKTYIFLLDNLCVKFEVNMIDSLQINTTHFTRRLILLKDLLSFDQECHDFFFVFESVNVLITVGIAALQHFVELFVQTFSHGQETSTHPKIKGIWKLGLIKTPINWAYQMVVQDVSGFHCKINCSKLQDIIYHHIKTFVKKFSWKCNFVD